jgi:hypothetical protein
MRASACCAFESNDWFCPLCPLTFRLGVPQDDKAEVHCPLCGYKTWPLWQFRQAEAEDGMAPCRNPGKPFVGGVYR